MSRESITVGSTAGGTRRAAGHYGRRIEEGAAVSEHNNNQGVRTQVTTFKHNQLPVATLDELHQRLPIGARIISAVLKVTEAFTATTATTMNFGLYQPDGTVIDADGIDAAVALTALDANDIIDCDGALVGAAVGLLVAGQVVVAPDVDDLLTGEMTITVQYELEGSRQQTMNG